MTKMKTDALSDFFWNSKTVYFRTAFEHLMVSIQINYTRIRDLCCDSLHLAEAPLVKLLRILLKIFFKSVKISFLPKALNNA